MDLVADSVLRRVDEDVVADHRVGGRLDTVIAAVPHPVLLDDVLDQLLAIAVR